MKKSFILIPVYIVSVFLLILGGALISNVVTEKNLLDINNKSLQAFYLAESGIDSALVYLRDQSGFLGGTAPVSPSQLQDVSLGNGSFSVTIDPYDNNATNYFKRYLITSTGTVAGIQRVLTLDITTDSFARYAYFTDDEHYKSGWVNTPVWFTSGDHIQGPLHTNSHLHLAGDPIFDGHVATVDDYLIYYNGGPPNDNPQFNDGLSLGVDKIPLPSKALDLRTAAVHDGYHLEGNTTIVLNSNGTINVTNPHNGWNNKNMSLPTNGAIFITGGNVYVSGTLSGQLSIGTNRDIVVTNNIVYNDDPRVNPASTDILGLIAERDVVISESAPYNLEIDASLMALGENFIVEDYWGDTKGTLTVYGGIIQKERGPVGTFGSGWRTGYLKDYIYDQRLVGLNPPFYPRTGDYVTILWRKG